MASRPDPRAGGELIRAMRARGLRDPRVLDAMARIPRERFVLPGTRDQSADDRALPIDCGQTISQPYMVAVMTTELALTGSERVLEIGTGSGYQTAILAVLAHQVFTVERHALLSWRARATVDGLGFENVRYRVGDGTLGWAEEAPYDRILITAGSPGIPTPLFAQLAEGGLMVLPFGMADRQKLTVVRKRGGRPVARDLFDCRFVKLIGEAGWSDEPGDGKGSGSLPGGDTRG